MKNKISNSLKIDLSFVLFEKYFQLQNDKIEICLKNKSTYIGYFKSFCRGDELDGEPYIISWRLYKNKEDFIAKPFEQQEGILINQKHIFSIKFFQDNTIMYF